MQKNALITGSDRGIGYSIAKLLGSNNYNVCINYLYNQESVEKLCAEIEMCGNKARSFRADITQNKAIKELFDFFEKEFGVLHLHINNAGITQFSPFLKTTEKLWKKVVFTDFKGAYFCAQAAAKNMIHYKTQGVIINISSNHATGCWPDASVYGPAKAALSKFGKHAALELAPYGIRVITLEPGYTDVGWEPSVLLSEIRKKIPLKRFAVPEEIGHLIMYLASEQALYITGCTITIDGGALLAVVPENEF